jgi:hypothetical protein
MLFSGQSTVREVVLFPHLSLSQDEVFRAVDRCIEELRPHFHQNHAAGIELLVRERLPQEINSRVASGELLRRIAIARQQQS